MRKALIVAMSRNRVIGRNNKLPWYLPGDLRYFKQATMGMPDTFAISLQMPLFRVGGSTGGAIQIDFRGNDLDQVSQAAGAAKQKLDGLLEAQKTAAEGELADINTQVAAATAASDAAEKAAKAAANGRPYKRLQTKGRQIEN